MKLLDQFQNISNFNLFQFDYSFKVVNMQHLDFYQTC